jgi:hypothetical protein
MPNVYTFCHKDGRKATSFDGSWEALVNAVGKIEANKIMITQERSEWVDLGKTNFAVLKVKGEIMGTFSKRLA